MTAIQLLMLGAVVGFYLGWTAAVLTRYLAWRIHQ